MDVVHVVHSNEFFMNQRADSAKCEWQCLFAEPADEIWKLNPGGGGYRIIYGFLHLFNTSSQDK